MVYESTRDVMLGVYVKLQKQKDTAMKKMQELTFQIRLLELNNEDTFLIKDLDKQKDTAQAKYEDAETQLKLLNKERDGGASLDPFLKEEVEFARE